MRILPRSAKGTWLLAAAVWGGVCAATWAVLPPQPRAEWLGLPQGLVSVDILPVGPTIVMLPSRMCGMVPPNGPAVLLNTSTGERRNLFTDGGFLPGFQMSPDGERALLQDSDGIRLLNPTSGATIIPIAGDHKPQMLTNPVFSPSGELLAYSDRVDGRPVVRVFNVRQRQLSSVVPDAASPIGFDDEGRRFAYLTEPGKGSESQFRIIGWPDQKLLTQLPLNAWGPCGFSPFKNRLFQAGYADDGKQDRFRCLEADSKTVVWEIRPDGHVLLPSDKGCLFCASTPPAPEPQSVTAWDTRDGRLLGRLTLGPGEQLADRSNWASTKDTSVAIETDGPPDHLRVLLAKWAPWLGIRADLGWVKLVDVVTGQTKATVPGGSGQAFFLPDGAIAVSRQDGLEVWELPLRPPLTWFAATAGVFALPIAFLACLRSRQLRRRVA